MKNPSHLFLSLTLLTLCAFASDIGATTKSFTAKLAAEKLITEVQKVSPNKLVAVGDNGHILISTDGDVWQQADVPIDTLLTAVFFINPQVGWAVGHDAVILNTKNGGATWTVQQRYTELDKPLLDVYFKNSNQGIAIGAYGMFYTTDDGGKTWNDKFLDSLLIEDDRLYLEELKLEDIAAYNDEKSSILPHFNRIYADGVTLYMVGEAGFLAKSNDFGETWIRNDEVYHGSFYDIVRAPDSSLIVVGLRGNVFRSTDHGENWQQVAVDTTSSINGVMIDNIGRVILTGNAGALLVSEDNGNSFRLVEQNDRKALINAVTHNDFLLISSEVGIKKIKSSSL